MSSNEEEVEITKATHIWSQLGNSVNETGLTLVSSLLDNASKKKSNWSMKNNSFALALSKSCQKSYTLLRS